MCICVYHLGVAGRQGKRKRIVRLKSGRGEKGERDLRERKRKREREIVRDTPDKPYLTLGQDLPPRTRLPSFSCRIRLDFTSDTNEPASYK